MPLPPPALPREPRHLRTIEIRGFRRSDGLYDIEGHLTDRRHRDLALPGGEMRRAGEPIHSMWLRLTIDLQANILDAHACSDAVPYPGFCDTIAPVYRQLIGDRIGPGFRGRVRKLFAGVRGCTHLTELISTMATGAIQVIAGDMDQNGDEKPFQLDACHALDTHGEAVRLFYPKWHRRRDPEAAT